MSLFYINVELETEIWNVALPIWSGLLCRQYSWCMSCLYWSYSSPFVYVWRVFFFLFAYLSRSSKLMMINFTINWFYLSTSSKFLMINFMYMHGRYHIVRKDIEGCCMERWIIELVYVNHDKGIRNILMAPWLRLGW